MSWLIISMFRLEIVISNSQDQGSNCQWKPLEDAPTSIDIHVTMARRIPPNLISEKKLDISAST